MKQDSAAKRQTVCRKTWPGDTVDLPMRQQPKTEPHLDQSGQDVVGKEQHQHPGRNMMDNSWRELDLGDGQKPTDLTVLEICATEDWFKVPVEMYKKPVTTSKNRWTAVREKKALPLIIEKGYQ